ncbi:uricase [Collybia nuda]|uniref:Uricase n=1 Tax=Collybia nuda TaxID=64659 RepID=A0A9P5YI95_9AGAR|nr:uricase [Collybia nuda]
MAESLSVLTSARYGKDKVRVLRVVREGGWHHVVEYNVCALLEGEIDISYTKSDNSVIVATDSIKNITYYIAKISPHILIPERFALHLGTHLVSRYKHIHKASVEVEQLRWTRIRVPVQGGGSVDEDHPHAFFRDGDEKRFVKVEIDGSAGKDKLVGRVTAGLTDLLVLKSTGSNFEGFIRDKYTTLKEVDDRIFSTSVDLNYHFGDIALPVPADEDKIVFDIPTGPDAGSGTVWDETVPARARRLTLEVFARDDSASVQVGATLYKMAQLLIAQNDGINSVQYALPNKHFIPVDMNYIGIDNLTP